jgi:hypothetical protein
MSEIQRITLLAIVTIGELPIFRPAALQSLMIGSRPGASHAGITSLAGAIVGCAGIAMLHVGVGSRRRQTQNHAIVADGLSVFRRLLRRSSGKAVVHGQRTSHGGDSSRRAGRDSGSGRGGDWTRSRRRSGSGDGRRGRLRRRSWRRNRFWRRRWGRLSGQSDGCHRQCEATNRTDNEGLSAVNWRMDIHDNCRRWCRLW